MHLENREANRLNTGRRSNTGVTGECGTRKYRADIGGHGLVEREGGGGLYSYYPVSSQVFDLGVS